MEKIIKNQGLGFHGECTVVRANLLGETKLPKDAEVVKPDAQNRLLVAHSESGHHHYVDAGSAVLYKTQNPLIKYLQVELGTHALLRHAKDKSAPDRHTTQEIPGGLHKIFIQRESTPAGWRQVQD
jgi:hypothetical protein